MKKVLVLCLFSAVPAFSQDYSDLRWSKHPEIAPRDSLCIERAALQLEPLQDSMFDLANLIVYSICTGEIYRAIHETGISGQIDKDGEFKIKVREAGQIIAGLRAKRLGVAVHTE